MTVRSGGPAAVAALLTCLIALWLGGRAPVAIAAAALAVAALLFAALRRLFDARLWRWTGMPDLGGCWSYEGAALNADGSTLYDWNARVTIEQDGAGVRVTLEAERSQSRSVSRDATLRRASDGRVTLRYDYESDPGHGGTASHAFFGVTQFVFDADLRTAEGHYFNYNGRYSFGRMVLTRV